LNINENDTVLDVGCGQGYGSYLLSQYAYHVYGFDKNDNFLEIADKMFKSDNLGFLNRIKSMSLDTNKVICNEIIEHLNKKNIKNLIQEIVYYTECEILYLTFPIGKNKPSKYNPYHKCEPSIEFVYNIVKKYFKKIEIEIDNFQNNYGHYQDYCIMVAK
jgi:cyclopropane fatty-acyl-phospholipid synthase-like methyltransferase